MYIMYIYPLIFPFFLSHLLLFLSLDGLGSRLLLHKKLPLNNLEDLVKQTKVVLLVFSFLNKDEEI